ARAGRRSWRACGITEKEAVGAPVRECGAEGGAWVEVVPEQEDLEKVPLVLRLVRVRREERRGRVPVLVRGPATIGQARVVLRHGGVGGEAVEVVREAT